jgi:TrmH family RNA methyltransferase
MSGPLITSTANPRVRTAIALRDRRERESRGRTLVDGVRELGRALDAGALVDEAFFCPTMNAGPTVVTLVGRLRAAGVHVTEVDERVSGRLAFGDRAEGIVGVVAVPATGLDELVIGADALVVVLDGLEKPGNLGAVLRSADGAGADAVILAGARTDPYNPNVVRASLGTVFAVPVAVATPPEVRAWLEARGVRIVATRVDASESYTDVDLHGATAIVLGAEATGLGDPWSGEGITSVSVPMRGVADSLNVSVTAAILLYEARRQRDEATAHRRREVNRLASSPDMTGGHRGQAS